jgi:hypothetical protein
VSDSSNVDVASLAQALGINPERVLYALEPEKDPSVTFLEKFKSAKDTYEKWIVLKNHEDNDEISAATKNKVFAELKKESEKELSEARDKEKLLDILDYAPSGTDFVKEVLEKLLPLVDDPKELYDLAERYPSYVSGKLSQKLTELLPNATTIPEAHKLMVYSKHCSRDFQKKIIAHLGGLWQIKMACPLSLLDCKLLISYAASESRTHRNIVEQFTVLFKKALSGKRSFLATNALCKKYAELIGKSPEEFIRSILSDSLLSKAVTLPDFLEVMERVPSDSYSQHKKHQNMLVTQWVLREHTQSELLELYHCGVINNFLLDSWEENKMTIIRKLARFYQIEPQK